MGDGTLALPSLLHCAAPSRHLQPCTLPTPTAVTRLLSFLKPSLVLVVADVADACVVVHGRRLLTLWPRRAPS